MLVVAAFLVFMIAAWLVHLLQLFFVIALVMVAGLGLFRLGRRSGRRSRR
jgi:hypothetical protein